MTTNSALYKCSIRHTRVIPKKNQFDVNFFWFSIDLNELEELNKRLSLFSLNRFNLYRFHEKDYLSLIKGASLIQRVENFLLENGISEKIKQVKLFSPVRVLGYFYTPTSFYFVRTDTNYYTLMELRNTFDEIKVYLIDHFGNEDVVDCQLQKNFYISPFSSSRNIFHIRITKDSDNIKINIKDYNQEGDLEVFTAMKSERTELNDKTLLWFIFRYPLTTIHVIVVTHWHVLVIFFKGTDYRTKNEESDFQEGYYETRPPDSANKTSFLSKVLFSDLIKQNMKKLGFKRNKE